jgi:hypothetical protein
VPSVSQKQHNLMAMVANNPAKAKELGIPQSVGKDFTTADKGMKFGKGPTKSRADLQKINSPKTLHGKNELFKKGGQTMAKEDMKMDKAQDKAMIKKAVGMHDKQLHGGKKTNLATLKNGGRTAVKGDHPVQKKAKVGAKMIKMCGGGMSKKK